NNVEELDVEGVTEEKLLETKSHKRLSKITIALILIALFLFVVALTLTLALVLTRSTQTKDDTKLLNMTINVLQLQNYTKEIVSYTPRMPGSRGGIATQNMFSRILSRYKRWNVEYDNFEENTPGLGVLNFTNIVATYNRESRGSAQANKALVISAHFDSQFQTFDNSFQGATDSAVPCAMILQFLDLFEDMMNFYNKEPNYDLRLIFFDGEEATRIWSGTDNTYGSRHLASLWESQNKLSNIDLFILLDLIGTADVRFPNFSIHFRSGSKAFERYEELATIETNLRQENAIGRQARYFNGLPGGYVEDDHIPFMNRGVPVLHLISDPFPMVWHSPRDNYDSLDWRSIQDIQKILFEFLQGHLFK
ncbi:hypothetical protein AKO1_010230, partial [Acrasis kona]